MPSDLYEKEFTHAARNSAALGISQIASSLLDYLLAWKWSPEGIDLLADTLKTLARREILRRGGDNVEN